MTIFQREERSPTIHALSPTFAFGSRTNPAHTQQLPSNCLPDTRSCPPFDGGPDRKGPPCRSPPRTSLLPFSMVSSQLILALVIVEMCINLIFHVTHLLCPQNY